LYNVSTILMPGLVKRISKVRVIKPQPVRDLWQRKDLGRFAGGYTVSIPAHGTVLIKVGQPSSTD